MALLPARPLAKQAAKRRAAQSEATPLAYSPPSIRPPQCPASREENGLQPHARNLVRAVGGPKRLRLPPDSPTSTLSRPVGIWAMESKEPELAMRRRIVVSILVAAGLAALTVGLVRSSWRLSLVTDGLIRGYARNLKLFTDEPQQVRVSEHPRLTAYYYPNPTSSILVILVHGSTALGRRASFPRLLAQQLHSHGLAVLAPDLRGFGNADDPVLPLEGSVGWEEDVLETVRYAVRTGKTQADRFVYVGHSLGAGVILNAARLEPHPRAVVALGATANLERDGIEWLRPFATRRFRDMRLVPDERSLDVMAAYLLGLDAPSQLESPGLPPILFVYGDRENRSARLPRQVWDQGDSLQLYIVPNAGHTYNIMPALGPVVFYNRPVLDQLGSVIAQWVERWAPASPR